MTNRVRWRCISLSDHDVLKWPLLVPLLVFLAIFFVYPVVRLIPVSVDYSALNFANYSRLATEAFYAGVMLRTFRICAVVTAVAVILGYLLALELNRIHSRFRTVLFGIVLLPFWTSVLVRTYAWIVLLQHRGAANRTLAAMNLIDRPLPLMFNDFGVVVGMVHVVLPFVVFPVYASLQMIPPNLYQAAGSLGADSLRRFWWVTLPLSLPAVVAGSMITFVFSLGFFITPAALGGSKVMMVSMLIDEQATQFLNWPLASSLAVWLVLLTVACLILYAKLVPERWVVG